MSLYSTHTQFYPTRLILQPYSRELSSSLSLSDGREYSRKAHTAASFVTSEYIFCVIRCEQCTKEISSCKYVVSSYSVPIKMNLNDPIPYFQEVGGVTNPLISYKL